MTQPQPQLSEVFSALGHPIRLAVLQRLTRGEASMSELAEPFNVTQMAVSKHVRQLERAGLVSRRKKAQQRICRLDPGSLVRVAGWLEAYRSFWEESFDALAELVEGGEGP